MRTVISKLKTTSIVTKTSLAYVLCVLLQKGIQMLTWPVFARMLTLEQYGQYTIYVSWVEIATVFLTLNLSTGFFPKAMEIFSEKRDVYISTCQTICICLSTMFGIVVLLFREKVVLLFGLPGFMLAIMIVNVVTYLPVQLIESRWRFLNQYKKAVILTSLYSVLSPIIALVLVLCNSEKGYAMIIGMVIIPTVIGLFLGIRNYITSKSVFNKDVFAFIIKSHVPLIAYFLSQTVLNQSDRIMIDHFCGKEKAAIYGMAYSLAILITLVSNALNNSYIPLLYEKINSSDNIQIHRQAIKNAVVVAMLVLCIVFFAPEIILVIGGRSYYSAIWIVPCVASSVLLLFYSQLFINIQLYYETPKPLAVISCVVTVLNIVLNAIAIPAFGYYAAGVTTLISYMVYTMLNYYIYIRIIRKNNKTNMYKTGQFLGLYLVFIVLVLAGTLAYKYLALRILVMLLIFLAFWFVQKKHVNIVKQ